MKPLRWGIVGAGKISGDFVEAIALLPPGEHQVVAVAASEQQRAHTFIEQHHLKTTANAYGTYDELFADDNVDVVYIGLLNHQHRSTVLAALDGGKHVLCEKPLGLNDTEVCEMVARAREKKRYLQEAFWSRFFPVYEHIREELKQHAIGDVRMVQANMGFPIIQNERISSLKFGGGVVLDLGCYLAQFTLLAFGADAKIEDISATGIVADSGVDRTVNVVIRLAGGRFAQLMCTGDVELDGHAIIAGTGGRLVLPAVIHAPETLIKTHVSPEHGAQSETLHFPVPTYDPKRFYYTKSSGLAYQATAVRKHIQAGLTECPEITLDESVKIAEILTEIRRQLGVRYPQETTSS